MEAHDTHAVLENLPPAREVTTAEEDAAAFPKLAAFDDGGVYVGRFAGDAGP